MLERQPNTHHTQRHSHLKHCISVRRDARGRERFKTHGELTVRPCARTAGRRANVAKEKNKTMLADTKEWTMAEFAASLCEL